MSISRIGGGGYLPPLVPAAPETPRPGDAVTQTDQPAPQALPPLLPHLRRHGLGKAARSRAGGRKKRDADNPHGADLSAESEDLLMMLEQHLMRDDRSVTKTGERGARDQGSSSQGRDPGGGAGGFERQQAATGDQARNGIRWTLHAVPRPARDETRLLAQWRAAATGKGPLARAERALLALPAGVRRAGAPDANMAASPTYPILAIVREFLAIPEGERTRPATLADVRDRLLAAAAPAGAGQSGGARPLSAAEESVNLLMPIVLLNLARHRTREGRAIGISSLAALIRRGRGW